MQILEGHSKMLFLQNDTTALGLNVDDRMDGVGTPEGRGTDLLMLSRFFFLMYPSGSTEGINYISLSLNKNIWSYASSS